MNSLDRLMQKRRRRTYKRMKRLFKARDMASPYVRGTVKMKKVKKIFEDKSNVFIRFVRLRSLADHIAHTMFYEKKIKALKPPPPPARPMKVKPSITILPNTNEGDADK